MKPIWKTLLVEDNPNDAYLIGRTLVMSDGVEYEITRVEDMDQLIAALETKYFDTIICDYHLPHLKFTDVIRAITYYDIEDIPLIIVSGSITQSEASELLGANTSYMYINKNELWLLGPYMKQVRQTEDSQFQIIQAFINALEYRDIVTRTHSERVVELTIELAHYMGVSKNKTRSLRINALLHDIGKIGISDRILLKPGPLDDAEMEEMKKHCEFGYRLLNTIPYLRKYSIIAYCHHERWNGTGYPRGLQGDNIPLFARIFSVVDVYDALTSDRPYRPKWETKNALAFLIEESGKTFDPDVVKAFVEMIGE